MKVLAANAMSCWLCEIANGTLTPIVDVRIPVPQDWVRTSAGFAAVVENESIIYLIDEESGQIRKSVAALPSNVHPRSIAAWNEWIFVCGHGSSESPDNCRRLPEDAFLLRSNDPWRVPVLLAYRDGPAGSTWNSILPTSVHSRKEFDALFTYGQRLIAVDNVIMPKYLVVFELDDSGIGDPSLIELPPHGTYEAVVSTALATSHLAILSSTVGEGGSGRYVSIVDIATFKERALIGAVEPAFGEGRLREHKGTEASKMLFDATSIAVVGDIIVLACGDKGLIVASLFETIAASDHMEAEVHEVTVIEFTGSGEAITRRVDSCHAPIVSHTLRAWCPLELRDRTVISVRTIEGADAIVLICREPNGRYWPFLIEGQRLRAVMGRLART